MTTLLLYYTQIPRATLEKYVPPQYHANINILPDWKIEKDGVLSITIDLNQRFVRNVTHIIPCCSSLSAANYAFQFRIKATTVDGKENSWHNLSPIGSTGYKEEIFLDSQASNLEPRSFIFTDLDLFVLEEQIRSAIIQMFVISSDLDTFQHAPSIVSFSLSDNKAHLGSLEIFPASFNKLEKTFKGLSVPLKSQKVEDPTIRDRICSPTCVSMVLDYFGQETTIADVVNRAYNAQYDMYGIWPANIWAASHWGILGYLLRFSSWYEVIWLLERGIPIIASVNYKKGELTNAAVEETQGHLLIIHGIKENYILVNDPAASHVEEVCREYQIEEVEKVWLKRKGIGYVLFPSD